MSFARVCITPGLALPAIFTPDVERKVGRVNTKETRSPFFDHERLEVYRAARQFNREVHQLINQLPRGQSEPRDNLRRAAMSITRNIAEGSGKWKIRDKVNFYHIARGSATECAACLDELVDFQLIVPSKLSPRSVSWHAWSHC